MPIVIPIQIHPDITLEREMKEYGSNRKCRLSYIIDYSMVAIEELDKNGEPISYSGVRYYGCRVIKGKIEILDTKQGWVVDEEATKAYIELEAEKELLK